MFQRTKIHQLIALTTLAATMPLAALAQAKDPVRLALITSKSGGFATMGADVANAYYAEEAEKVTAPVVKFLKRHGIEAKVVHKTGGPGELIAKQANAGGYDLVMMGSHGHSALGNLVMGSVATKVMAHCGTPVLLVR